MSNRGKMASAATTPSFDRLSCAFMTTASGRDEEKGLNQSQTIVLIIL
jgi:hypothetical protein